MPLTPSSAMGRNPRLNWVAWLRRGRSRDCCRGPRGHDHDAEQRKQGANDDDHDTPAVMPLTCFTAMGRNPRLDYVAVNVLSGGSE